MLNLMSPRRRQLLTAYAAKSARSGISGSATEIAALKTKDDLVTLVQSKYSLEKSQAQRDADAFARGRQL